jgi:acyl carrier protein
MSLKITSITVPYLNRCSHSSTFCKKKCKTGNRWVVPVTFFVFHTLTGGWLSGHHQMINWSMIQSQPIIDKINGILSEEFEVDTERIIPGANVRQVMDLDSLDYVDLAVLIEKGFSIKVKPEDFTRIITFSDLHEYIISQFQHNELTDRHLPEL